MGMEDIKPKEASRKSQIDTERGEPLNAEVVIWGEEKFGSYPENWWQTETVGIMSQLSFDESKTRFYGKTLPGIEIAIAEVNGQG
jgi:acetyl-CoA synthetase